MSDTLLNKYEVLPHLAVVGRKKTAWGFRTHAEPRVRK
jgi:hypothetical protein